MKKYNFAKSKRLNYDKINLKVLKNIGGLYEY